MLTVPLSGKHKQVQRTTKVIINESIKRLLVALEQQRRSSSQSIIEIHRNMESIMLDVIARLAFNMNQEDDSNDNNKKVYSSASVAFDIRNDNNISNSSSKQLIVDIYEEQSKFRMWINQFLNNNQNCSSLMVQLGASFPWLERIISTVYSLIFGGGGGELIPIIMEQLNKSIIGYYQKRIREKFGAGSEIQKPTTNSMNILDYMLDQQGENLSETELIGKYNCYFKENVIIIIFFNFLLCSIYR